MPDELELHECNRLLKSEDNEDNEGCFLLFVVDDDFDNDSEVDDDVMMMTVVAGLSALCVTPRTSIASSQCHDDLMVAQS